MEWVPGTQRLTCFKTLTKILCIWCLEELFLMCGRYNRISIVSTRSRLLYNFIISMKPVLLRIINECSLNFVHIHTIVYLQPAEMFWTCPLSLNLTNEIRSDICDWDYWQLGVSSITQLLIQRHVIETGVCMQFSVADVTPIVLKILLDNC